VLPDWRLAAMVMATSHDESSLISICAMPAVGVLVRCTDRSWIARPPTRCPRGHRLAPGRVLVGHQPPSSRSALRWIKDLLRTSDLILTAEDLAAAYKQLIAVERGWRDCKTSLGLRPVYHHREDRIRAHVQLCWLALLLIRVAETRTGDTWRNLRHELDRMHLVTFATADGRVAQRSALTGDQKTILAALELTEPPKYLDFTPGTDAAVAD
jgi:hypothetical protein